MRNWTEYQEFTELWAQLKYERKRRGSPLRTPTVATFGTHFPKQRTMVLRGFEDCNLVFFTDKRSDKCKEILNNQAVSVHCYVTKSRLQVQFYGHATLITDHPKLKQWENLGLQNPADYSTINGPGTLLEHGDEVFLAPSLAQDNFGVMLIDVQELHLLQLGNPHLRCQWIRQSNDIWHKQWLVP